MKKPFFLYSSYPGVRLYRQYDNPVKEIFGNQIISNMPELSRSLRRSAISVESQFIPLKVAIRDGVRRNYEKIS